MFAHVVSKLLPSSSCSGSCTIGLQRFWIRGERRQLGTFLATFTSWGHHIDGPCYARERFCVSAAALRKRCGWGGGRAGRNEAFRDTRGEHSTCGSQYLLALTLNRRFLFQHYLRFRNVSLLVLWTNICIHVQYFCIASTLILSCSFGLSTLSF